jgi:hypothetical protein
MRMRTVAMRMRGVGVCAGLVLTVLGFSASPAVAGSAWWGLSSGSWPSNLPAGGVGRVVLSAQNRGDASASGIGEPVTVRDVLPTGLTAKKVEGIAGNPLELNGYRGPFKCSLASPHEAVCVFESASLPSGEDLEAWIEVKVGESASSEEVNTVSVSGGETGGEKTLQRHINVGEETPFGVENYELLPEEEGGAPVTQAGAHPFQLTSVISLNTSTMAPNPLNQQPAGLPKNLTFQLPPGLLGNPTPVPQCTTVQFASEKPIGVGHDECEAQTAIGLATITFDLPGNGTHLTTRTVPLFNITPQPGEPARFGFEVFGDRVYIDTAIRTGSDYGVTVTVPNITEAAGFLASKVTFWGVPGDSAHNSARGWACVYGEEQVGPKEPCSNAKQSQPPPFLSMPTSCTGPMSTTVQADSWAEQNPKRPFEAPLFEKYEIGGLDGCNRLQFAPQIGVAPDVPNASTPTGLEVKVHIPQSSVLNPASLADSALESTTVALPVGVAVNPGGADGLEACSEGLIGYLPGQSTPPENLRFTPALTPAGEVLNPGIDFCSNASKVGTVEIETPLLPHALKGAVYLATQNENPFDTLLAMYIVAEDPVSGSLVKLPGQVTLDPNTGQLVSTFTNTPQVPFEDLRLHFFGESRAPLGTPAFCGAYTTHASFVPWSGNQAVASSSTFDITSGPNGSACHNPLPFAPSLAAGTTSIQAGGFSPFTMTMSRPDGSQDLQGVQLHMPRGLLGTLASVTLCGEGEANTGTCGPNSLIGETTVSVGLGGNPYSVTGGKVYITGPYDGAPYGLSIVNPAKAGPFDLGNVIVRAKIEVDPITAALTATTDPSGPHAIPHILDGIPLQIQHINVNINRPDFTFNPTNCDPLQITGTLGSDQGASSTVATHFQATNCATLAFKPQFKVTTQGHTSRTNGASLNVKLSYPSGAFGEDANISEVKVNLPAQLPSRLTTLQKACPDHVFEENPAACPAASRIGSATASTPILASSLSGPAYFVSHGGAAFPELIIVLSGNGVTVQLHGETFISKTGITSSTFRTVPDVPVNTFELNLPQGPNSALGANTNLCKIKHGLKMPTLFIAQNGMTIHQTTPVKATGCPKVKKPKKAKKSSRKHAKKASRRH